MHFHPDLEELYYVISGYGTMAIGDEKQEISRNDVVYIPKLAPHTLLNSGKCAAAFHNASVKVRGTKRMSLTSPEFI